MVEISFISKQQLESFKDGANVSTAIIYNSIDNETFRHNGSLQLASDLYNNSVLHINLQRVAATIEASLTEFNKDTVADIMEAIVELDQQMYYDIFVILLHMLKAKDVAEQKTFIESILNIAKNEASDEDQIITEAPAEVDDEEIVSEIIENDATEEVADEVVEESK